MKGRRDQHHQCKRSELQTIRRMAYQGGPPGFWTMAGRHFASFRSNSSACDRLIDLYCEDRTVNLGELTPRERWLVTPRCDP